MDTCQHCQRLRELLKKTWPEASPELLKKMHELLRDSTKPIIPVDLNNLYWAHKVAKTMLRKS